MARDSLNRTRPICSLVLAAFALAGCASDPSEPLDRRSNEVLAKEWQLFIRQDEKWPAAREQWLAGPPAERQLLLDNLLRELLSDDSAGRGNGTSYRSLRARRELTWFGSEAVPPLVEGLEGLGSRERVDGVALERIAGGLAELRATKELAELAAPPVNQEPRALPVRTAALRALATIDDPSVGSLLAARLSDDPDWQVRGVAAELLRRRPNDPLAKPALAAAVGDKDGFVRAQAVRSLTERGSTDANSVPLSDVLRILARDPERPVRVAAAEALNLYSFVPEVEAGLLAALHDREPDVVVAAAAALVNAKTRKARLGLVDAFARFQAAGSRDARAAGVLNELIRILGANLGARPVGKSPDAWRELVDQRSQEE